MTRTPPPASLSDTPGGGDAYKADPWTGRPADTPVALLVVPSDVGGSADPKPILSTATITAASLTPPDRYDRRHVARVRDVVEAHRAPRLGSTVNSGDVGRIVKSYVFREIRSVHDFWATKRSWCAS